MLMERPTMNSNNTPNRKKKNTTKKWLRIIHRDLGFLMVGICLVYGLSGIILNHMNDGDPAYKTVEETLSFEKNLSTDALTEAWNTKEDLPTLKLVREGKMSHQVLLDGGVGIYHIETGELSYEHHTKRPFIFWINKLHYNKIGGWTIMADIFAISLLFFAISGLFIVSKKQGIMGRGKWLLIAGILIPILFIMIS